MLFMVPPVGLLLMPLLLLARVCSSFDLSDEKYTSLISDPPMSSAMWLI